MPATVHTGAIVGLESAHVEVEADISKKGFGKFIIVGLPDKAIDEARQRVRAALFNSKLELPKYYITVNLAPADLKKEGPAYDLPIALAILLAAQKNIFSYSMIRELDKSLVTGELSLDGTLRPTTGILPLTLLAKEKGFKKIYLPAQNAREASIVKGVQVMPVSSLTQLFTHLTGLASIKPAPTVPISQLIRPQKEHEFDFADIKGQEQVKRALEIAAAGSHNVALTGPPGAGKTLLARSLPSILPRLTAREALEVTRIYSILGFLSNKNPLIKSRPFRSPHHTTSRAGLIGGGSKIQPGEISLAHRGVLFLDEFPELPRHVLESLRQPIEDGFVQISRARGTITFPSRFMLVAASNPCPCGFLGSKKQTCRCTSTQIQNYKKRVSGPIWDRIDMHVDVPAVEVDKLIQEKSPKLTPSLPPPLTSSQIQQKVQRARDLQLTRYQKLNIQSNSELPAKRLGDFCPLDDDSQAIMKQAMSSFALSVRAYHKILKVARTIADLAESEKITAQHLSESLQYRTRFSS